MATAPAARRHALGMPAGSVRALLGVSVLGLMWAMALRDPTDLPQEFLYLAFLSLIILTHYFTSHSKTMGKGVGSRPALGLPRGTIRLVLLGGFLGLMAFLWKHATDAPTSKPLKMPENVGQLFAVIGLLMVGFFIGYIITHLFRAPSGEVPAWLQDVQAWLALLAAVALGVLVIIRGVINPTLTMPINVDNTEAVLAALIGFYFGARS